MAMPSDQRCATDDDLLDRGDIEALRRRLAKRSASLRASQRMLRESRAYVAEMKARQDDWLKFLDINAPAWSAALRARSETF